MKAETEADQLVSGGYLANKWEPGFLHIPVVLGNQRSFEMLDSGYQPKMTGLYASSNSLYWRNVCANCDLLISTESQVIVTRFHRWTNPASVYNCVSMMLVSHRSICRAEQARAFAIHVLPLSRVECHCLAKQRKPLNCVRSQSIKILKERGSTWLSDINLRVAKSMPEISAETTSRICFARKMSIRNRHKPGCLVYSLCQISESKLRFSRCSGVTD